MNKPFTMTKQTNRNTTMKPKPYYIAANGKEHAYASLDAAQKVASEIFSATGIVVSIYQKQTL